MKRISNTEVELTDEEQFARDFFEDQLDGHDIDTAVKLTKGANSIFEDLSDEFYKWLGATSR